MILLVNNKWGNNNQHKEHSTLEYIEDFIYCMSHSSSFNDVIFKGGITLLCAFKKYNYANRRLTKDIDIHGTDYNKWMNFKRDIISCSNYSFFNVRYKIIKEIITNEATKNESVSIGVYNNSGLITKFSIDVNFKWSTLAAENYSLGGLVNIKGYTTELILVDKIHACESKQINRRLKDLFDVYSLSFLKEYNSIDLVKLYIDKYKGIPDKMYMFQLENLKELEYGYGKLKGIEAKPDFKLMYKRVCNFLIPLHYFILNKSNTNYVWRNNQWILQE
ncbi:TPA: nucleotidyl transferase AbiEii/AbiGii toxin family protein [Clostridioides difficile]|nr:nucleotidyl transferase AbiEii/AbiGii toxin family protein [Clostridioides difficile]